MSGHAGGYSADPRIRRIEFLPWIVAIAAFFLLPEYLSLGARILIYILYALSLDLIVGYAGIITLGHSAYVGLGAYVAGILAAKAGVGVQVGSQVGETAILSAAGRHLAAALPTVAFVEGSFGTLLLAEDVSVESVRFGHRGEASLLTGPGLGIRVVEERLRRRTVAVHELTAAG